MDRKLSGVVLGNPPWDWNKAEVRSSDDPNSGRDRTMPIADDVEQRRVMDQQLKRRAFRPEPPRVSLGCLADSCLEVRWKCAGESDALALSTSRLSFSSRCA
jgi:hypothetical protein